MPRRELRTRHQHLGAPRQERPHREREHLVEARRRALTGVIAPTLFLDTLFDTLFLATLDTGRRGVPATDEWRERVAVARQRDELRVLVVLEASKRRRISAVWRNVSRKSVQSSGMSVKRTSGRPAACCAVSH